MAAVTVRSDFEAQENKICPCTAIFKMGNQKGLICTAHGTVLSVVAAWIRGELWGERVHAYAWLSPVVSA